MILNRQKLTNILGILGNSVGNKILKVADYVFFRVDRENRKLFLSTTDFNCFITINYGDLGISPVDDLPEMFLVQYGMLNSIVKSSTTEEVMIKEEKINGPIVISTNGRYELPRYNEIDEFPDVDYSNKEIGSASVPVVLSAWNKAVISISEDVTRINYQGVNFDGRFAATDNRKLSIVESSIPYSGDPLLMMPNFGKILKCCKDTVKIGVSNSGKHMIVSCDQIGMISSIRLIDAKFINYLPLLEKKEDGVVLVLPKVQILGVLSRLSIFTDQLFKVVCLKVIKRGGSIVADFSVTNQGQGSELITAKSFSLPMELIDIEDGQLAEEKYQLDNLIDGISVTDDQEEVSLNIQSDGKMWIEEDDFNYLLVKVTE